MDTDIKFHIVVFALGLLPIALTTIAVFLK